MRKTDLKPLQVTDLITDCVDSVMRGNSGIACSRLRRAFTVDAEDTKIKDLNKALILEELETRKRVKQLIRNFIDKDGTQPGT